MELRTQYLNGLKGICAILVLMTHHQHWGRSSYESTMLERSFGFQNQHHFATLPFVRLIFSGAHFGVAIFFTISGYVLSLQPVLLIRNDQHERLANYLGSAVFRRWLRLLLPVMGSVVVFLILWHGFEVDVPYMERQFSIFEDLIKLACEMAGFAWIFARDTSPTGYGPMFSFNDHLWTIPLELKGSMIVFVSLLVATSFTYRGRLRFYILLIIYLLYAVDGWFGAMFIMGTTICELDLEFASKPQSQGRSGVIPLIAFLCGMYLAGVPHTPNEISLSNNPGWYWLSTLKPRAMPDPKWFYLFWASALVTWSTPRLSYLRTFLETNVCQSLGKVSYSVYLVHGPILWTIGDHLYMLSYLYLNSDSNVSVDTTSSANEELKFLGYEPAFVIPCLLLMIFTFLVARLHRMLIDVPIRNFSNKVWSTVCQ